MSFFKKRGAPRGTFQPRTCDGFPIDANAEERFSRFTGTFTPMPVPTLYGYLSGLAGFNNSFQLMRAAQKRIPFGPGITTQPMNLQNQLIFPTLSKQGSA